MPFAEMLPTDPDGVVAANGLLGLLPDLDDMPPGFEQDGDDAEETYTGP